MWGGKREGAGRKSLETVRIRVPVAVLDKVNEVISSYKVRNLKSSPEIKKLKSDPEIKKLKASPENIELKADLEEIKPLKSDPEIKKLKSDPEIKKAVKDLQGLKTRTIKELRKAFGTLRVAAQLGVRAKPDGGIFVPYQHQSRLSSSCL